MPRQIPYQPFGKNGLASDYMFVQRKYYKNSPLIYPSNSNLPKPLDIWYDKPLYGKVDAKKRFVYPNPASLKKIHKDLSAINFVADAYIDFAAFVETASKALRTCMTSIIDVKKPVKAYENLPLLYYDYFINVIDQGFLNTFLTSKQKNNIASFEDYIHQYLAYVQVNTVLPHTLIAYLSSNRVSNRISGMIIEFSRDPYDQDNLKWQKYLSSDFFPDYARIAANFGFYINKNIPWAIAANLNAKGMKKYMNQYDVSNAKQSFNNNFLQAEYISYISFKKYMFASYNSFITFQPAVEVLDIRNCIKNNTVDSTYSTKRFVVSRPTEFDEFTNNTYLEFIGIYPDRYFLQKYLQIRLLETDIQLSRRRYRNLVNILLDKLNKIGLYATIMFLGDFLITYSPSAKKQLTSKETSANITTNNIGATAGY